MGYMDQKEEGKMKKEDKGSRMLLDRNRESMYLQGQLVYFKQKIEEIENDLDQEDMIVFTNNTKTMMQNPKIKILNDYTKNLLSIYAQMLKLDSNEEKGKQEPDALDDFIQSRNKAG